MESREKGKIAYRQAIELLSRKPRPLGIYLSTANSIPVLRAMEEKHSSARFRSSLQICSLSWFPTSSPERSLQAFISARLPRARPRSNFFSTTCYTA